MTRTAPHTPLARRSFLTRLSAGAAAFGAAFGGGAVVAEAQTARGPWQPRRHAQDDWLDRLPGQHRLIFDATTAEGLERSLTYTRNYLQASETTYGLKSADVAVVIIARHLATVFAYDDSMWAKYPLAQTINFIDRRTKESPTTNSYWTGRDFSLETLAKAGVHYAVCQMATKVFADSIARRTSGDADAIQKDLLAHLIPNSHAVAAGIVTVNRGQECGYTLAHGG